MIKPFIMNGGEICRLLKGRKYNVLNNSVLLRRRKIVFFADKISVLRKYSILGAFFSPGFNI